MMEIMTRHSSCITSEILFAKHNIKGKEIRTRPLSWALTSVFNKFFVIDTGLAPAFLLDSTIGANLKHGVQNILDCIPIAGDLFGNSFSGSVKFV